MTRWPCRPVLLVLALAVAGAGCGGERRDPAAAAAAAAPPAPPVAAPDSTAAPVPRDALFETSLSPVHDVEVTARAEGVVMAQEVEEGARVREGDRLAQIDDRGPKAVLAEREAETLRAGAAFERARRLHEQSMIAEEAFTDARAAFDVAKAQRERAALDVEHCVVRAPFAGLVAQRRVQRGQTVKVGDALFRISDPGLLRAELLLPESMLGSVRSGQEVTLVPVAGGPPTRARVTRVTPLVDPASGTFRVTIDLDNRIARLPAGVTVRVDLGATVPRAR